MHFPSSCAFVSVSHPLCLETGAGREGSVTAVGRGGGAGSVPWVRGEEGAPSPAPGTAPPAPCCVSGGPCVDFMESWCAVTLVPHAVEVQDGVTPPRSVPELHLKKESGRLGTNLVWRWAGPAKYPVMSGAPPERERLWGCSAAFPSQPLSPLPLSAFPAGWQRERPGFQRNASLFLPVCHT